MKSIKIFPCVLIAVAVSGCANTRLGANPELSPMSDLSSRKAETVSMPMPEPKASKRNQNSLWQSGSTTFFRDQRAAQPGDILTVLVDIRDEARLKNETTRNRQANEKIAAPNLLGLGNKTAPIDLNDGIGLTSQSTTNGKGEVKRDEKIRLKVAAVVTQKLPNGNLVIRGKQQIRVNTELRDLTVTGVIRPQDIDGQNTVTYDQIAEARISYGGKGVISDVQTPRYGQRAVDVVLPW